MEREIVRAERKECEQTEIHREHIKDGDALHEIRDRDRTISLFCNFEGHAYAILEKFPIEHKEDAEVAQQAE